MSDLKKGEILSHIKEECIRDPLYLTKIIVHSFGKNALGLVVRIAAYIAVYWIITSYTDIPKGVVALLILVVIMAYHSSRAVIDRIKKEANGVKGGS